jgi:maltooligosyltrehalose trehalohydrolase
MMGMLWGPVLREDGATFRLWAPSSESVSLEVEGMEAIPMQAVGEGWYAADAPAKPGARYRFRVSPDLLVPDPAARAQAEDVHGASVLIDQHRYQWRNTEWRGRPWHETVLYELHVGACGGYAGVRILLPRLRTPA